jgi:hypothetical protein
VTRRDHSHSAHDDSVGSDPEWAAVDCKWCTPALIPSPLEPAPDNPSRLMVSALCWLSPRAQEIARIPHRTARVLTRVDIIVPVMVSCERRTAYALKVTSQRVFIPPNALLLEGHMTVVVYLSTGSSESCNVPFVEVYTPLSILGTGRRQPESFGHWMRLDMRA